MSRRKATAFSVATSNAAFCPVASVMWLASSLLLSATKYAPQGTTISVSVAREGDLAKVRVADEGPGVASEDRERIFHPFVRGNGASTGVPGSGIGLYACRRLVEAQGGRLWYEDPGGGGAAFVFTLPLASS